MCPGIRSSTRALSRAGLPAGVDVPPEDPTEMNRTKSPTQPHSNQPARVRQFVERKLEIMAREVQLLQDGSHERIQRVSPRIQPRLRGAKKQKSA